MRHRRAWTMPVQEARTFLQQLQQKIASSEIEVAHRDVLIRLRSIIEEDLEAETRAAKARSHSDTISVGPQRGPGSVMCGCALQDQTNPGEQASEDAGP